MKLENVRIEGWVGRWHEIDRRETPEGTLILLEHNVYGDTTEGLIVTPDLKVVMDDIWNGFSDYVERKS